MTSGREEERQDAEGPAKFSGNTTEGRIRILEVSKGQGGTVGRKCWKKWIGLYMQLNLRNGCI